MISYGQKGKNVSGNNFQRHQPQCFTKFSENFQHQPQGWNEQNGRSVRGRVVGKIFSLVKSFTVTSTVGQNKNQTSLFTLAQNKLHTTLTVCYETQYVRLHC